MLLMILPFSGKKDLLPNRMCDTLVVCPVYNEESYINEFCSRLKSQYRGDMVFIDDGSTDKGIEILNNSMNEEKTRTHVLYHKSRQGYGAALITGFQYALNRRYGKIITIDADLQHQPEDIHRFVNRLDEYDVVLGSRYTGNPHPSDIPKSRLIINKYISSLLTELLSHHHSVKFTDPFCGFRGYRRSFLKKTRLGEQSYGISLEILLEIIRIKATASEIPVKPIYIDNSRIFYDGLNDPFKRLNYYKGIISNKMRELECREV